MNNNNANTFERSRKKSLSTKKEVDFFNSEDSSLKRLSKIHQKKQTISEFNDSNIDNIKLTRSSLPMEFNIDNLSNYKNNNLEENNFDKRSSNNSKDLDNSSRDKLSNQNIGKNKIVFDSFQGGIKDIKVVWKNKPQDKDKEEEKDQLDKEYENIEKFLNYFGEKCKMNDNLEVNYSNSTLGQTGSKKSMSKSDDKNIKVNLKNIINYDKSNSKKNLSGVILSDLLNAEKAENKLDILISIMEEYKDIIMEKTFCKNFQDRLILNIFICLSRLSFKLYNCTENKTKFENMRKYICSFTDDIKYNLINNPNFTINLINQKLIDINSINKKSLNNRLDNFRLNDNNPINMIGSEQTFNSKSSPSDFSESSYSNSDSNKVNKENYINFHDEEIIYENFEEFKIDDGNDNDIYINPNLLYEIDTKNNNMNNFEQNCESKKKSSVENNFGSPQKKSTKTKVRRNATNGMLLHKHHPKNPNSNNNNTIHYFNPHNYDFHIMDINGQIDNKDISSESIDSDEDCIEVTESHKFEKPKLIFFEDYVKDKDKRRLTKVESIEIKPDQNILNQKTRLYELNSISYKNIINIVNDDPSILPKHQLNLNPIAIANFIKEKEQDQIINEKEKEEKEEKSEDSKYLFYGRDSSNDSEDVENDDDNESKEVKRFTFVDRTNTNIKDKSHYDNIDENKNNDFSELSDKSMSIQNAKNYFQSRKLLKLDFDYDNEDD